jgi:hypothetical protein
MESELKRILALDVPVAHLKYKGNSKKYVVWTIINEEPLFSYEDDIQYSKVTVDIDIYSDSNYLNVMSSIKNIMKQNEWTWEEDSSEFYENDTKLYHKTCTFSKERKI